MINIAIDGPAGAGKSYLARTVAARLGYIYVDTGALYRSVALYMLRSGISAEDPAAVIAALPLICVELSYSAEGEQSVILNGEDVSCLIRTPEVSAAASTVSAIPEVRSFLLGIQKKMAREHNVVMDGRDIGTVILPDADVKIFLCANDETRAKRRTLELEQKGIHTTVEEVLAEMRQRDKKDSERTIAPAIAAPDAVILDNSLLDREGTVEAALAIIAEKVQ